MYRLRMRTTHNSRGFTIVELMVVVALSAFIFFGLAILYMTVMDWWDRAISLMNLQRDGSYALFDISTAIRSGSNAAISPSSSLEVKNQSGTTIAQYYWETSDNTLRDISGQKIIPSLVDSLHFVQSGKTVSMILILADSEQQEAYFSTSTSLRN